jgi:hypothetical protein
MMSGSPKLDLVLVFQDGPSLQPSTQGLDIRLLFKVTPNAIATVKQRHKTGQVRRQQGNHAFVSTGGRRNRGDA